MTVENQYQNNYSDRYWIRAVFKCVEKPMPKQLLRPITTGANGKINHSEFLAITCNLLNAREKSRVQGAPGYNPPSQLATNSVGLVAKGFS